MRKIREVISNRVAAKIVDLAKKDGEAFEPIWEDIHTFVKYGMMREDKFYDKVKDHVIYTSTGDSKFTTLPDYLERAKENHENKVYYANNEAAQSTYIKLFKSQGLEVLILDAMIDSHFIQFLESKNTDVKFERVDSDVTENLLDQDASKKIVEGADNKTKEDRIEESFKKALEGIKGLFIRVETLKDGSVPGMILLNEQSRRFKEMTRMMGNSPEAGDLFAEHTLLVNTASPAVDKALELAEQGDQETADMLMEQIYDLAMLSQQSMNKDRMSAFLERSSKLLGLI